MPLFILFLSFSEEGEETFTKVLDFNCWNPSLFFLFWYTGWSVEFILKHPFLLGKIWFCYLTQSYMYSA
jgi:hypothetical protein